MRTPQLELLAPSLLAALAALSAGCSGGDTTPQTKTAVTCEGSTLPLPDDPGARGPWPVGARTVKIAGLRAEVWYPAEAGSESGNDKISYDLREHLPDVDQGKIPDADNPLQPCDCYRDLPIDAGHGPYPVVLFLHGTASFRTQSATQATHWASRGFVVVAADHPQLELKDALEFKLGADQAGDALDLLDAIDAPAGEIDWLAGRVSTDRKAIVGYSAGGRALKELGGRAGVRVLVPMAAGGVEPGEALLSTLILGAMNDQASPYPEQQEGYDASPSAKRLIGLKNAGHLTFTDLCIIGAEQGGLLQIAVDYGVTINPLIVQLTKDTCKEDELSVERGWQIVNYATAAALEERLACDPDSAARLSAIEGAFPEVGEYKEAL